MIWPKSPIKLKLKATTSCEWPAAINDKLSPIQDTNIFPVNRHSGTSCKWQPLVCNHGPFFVLYDDFRSLHCYYPPADDHLRYGLIPMLAVYRAVIRDLTKLRWRWQGERYKSNRFNEQNNNSAQASHFLYISLLSLHSYDVKWPNFKFTWEQERQDNKFYLLCLNSGAAPSLQLQPKFPSFK